MGNTDISVEPLLNLSSVGAGAERRLAVVTIDAVGVATHRTPITVISSAQEITIAVGKKNIELHNSGSKLFYYGGSGVTSSNGIRIAPNQTKPFSNVKDTFSIFVVTDGAETTEVRIVEYD